MNNRQLDIAVARLLGLDVLGHIDGLGWRVVLDKNDEERLQPVFLSRCMCNPMTLPELAGYFGHNAACLKIVPFYHKDPALTVAALERISFERGIISDVLYRPSGWTVNLYDRRSIQIVSEKDKSFPLAVVKALARLEQL